MRVIHPYRAAFSVLLLCAHPLFAQDGAALYRSTCATCHDSGAERIPSRETLSTMTPERVLAALESGAMIAMASRLSAAERHAVAEFVTGKSLSATMTTSPLPEARCRKARVPFNAATGGSQWDSWGANLANTRAQDTALGGLTAADIRRLKLKWAFGFQGDSSSIAQPTIAGGRVFVGSQSGTVYSLSADTGCVYWWFDAPATVRSAVVIGRIEQAPKARFAAFFGDVRGAVYAIWVDTGELLWKMQADPHSATRITGSPTFYKGRLYVPVSSSEAVSAIAPDYECCRFRGSVVALEAATGKQIWKSYTVSEEPHPTSKNKSGTQLWGPAGAPIWSPPTIDVEKNILYVTTGENSSHPATATSDAFLAMDLESGRIVWSKQVTSSDVWTAACRMVDKSNCPEPSGPDFDFGSPPILTTLPNGRRALIAGQKSGVVYAVDPDNRGEIIWRARVGKGGTLGGIEWGSAADQSNVYVAVSDVVRIAIPGSLGTEIDPSQGGGMFALSLDSGERAWYVTPPGCGDRKRCSPAQSAAVSAIPGAVFSGSMDGHLRAYSAKDGTVLWDFDTARSYKTINLVEARGGSLDGGGPAIAHRMLFVTSGYVIWGGMPGNVLLAFSPVNK